MISSRIRAGDAVEGPFLFNEKNQKVERFPGMPDLKKAIEERQLIALKREELDDYFNLGSSLRPLVVLLYMPCIFAVMMLQLREYPVRQRTKIAGFMVVEGAVVSAAALWLVLGLAGLFLTFKFGGYNFHLNTVVNLATMVFSLFLIWTMLYLNEEVTQHRHQTLVNAARFISFVCFTIFIYWMASVLLEPSLPPDYWQGQF